MPRPVFDIEQYELRLIKPDVFTKEQSDRLNLVTSRVNQQLDWTAQLLGMNGSSYWGLPDLKSTGEYTWHGLPETPNEKRQLQTVTFGVYDKDREYGLRPAPFNREDIKASGDQGFRIWEKDGITYLSPLGGSKEATFDAKPFVFAGGSYVFDFEVEFLTPSVSVQQYYSYTFQGVDRLWTRLFVNTPGELIGVRRKGSTANYFWLIPIQWEDISDWKSDKVLNDYIGLWGNKGNNFSFDAALDALDVHGFDEARSLVLRDTKSCFTMKDLLATVGLKSTPWTGYYNQKFGFKVNNSTTVYPLPPQSQDPALASPFLFYEYDGCNFDFQLTQESAIPEGNPNVLYDDGFFDKDSTTAECSLDNGTFADFGGATDTVDDGTFNQRLDVTTYPCYTFDEPAISRLCFEYFPREDAPCSLLDMPCVEWVFDPSLDNGEYNETISTYLAWAEADDGQYDRDPLNDCFNATQGTVACADGYFCGFDDGVFGDPSEGGTEYFEPNCTPIPLEKCPVVDGGYLDSRAATPPDYAVECNCAVECCDINDGVYVILNGVGQILPPINDGTIDGGEYLYFDLCTTYDNDDYDRDPLQVDCQLDDGDFDDVNLTTVESGIYDRFAFICPECDGVDPTPDPIPCPVTPVRVNLEQIYTDFKYKMEPNVANSLTPLRVWKSRPLTVVDTVPPDSLDQYNFLRADYNKGPDPFDSFRYYLRLPLEYVRNGKFWNRAISVASNQGYFSAPTHLSETQNDPAPERPALWDETYNDYALPPSTVYYNEPYLVSTIRTDSQGYEAGFEDAAIVFEEDEVNPFAPALVTTYDPLAVRIPFTNGDWRGEYYVQGSVVGKKRSGFIDIEVAAGVMAILPEVEHPVWDESRIKRPNLEFPDDPDTASLKDYVVSYAYFAADFAAADDPVFDPDNEICWRKKEVACFTSTKEGDADFNQITDCTLKPRSINSAYLLHPDGTATEETRTPSAVIQVAARDQATSGGYASPSGGGGSGY